MGVAVIDRSQAAAPELLGQLVGIDQVAFVAAAAALPVLIADKDVRHQRGDQIVQPLGLGAFFKGDVNGPARPRKNSTIADASVGTIVRAMTRPPSSRTEETVLA